MSRLERLLLGRYIVVDPGICHGQPTFVGTRIMVSQVLRQIAKGMTADAIMREWRGKVSREAIAEAVEVADRGCVEDRTRSAVASQHD
jgi:uncharacterized protein (DUF433 family)